MRKFIYVNGRLKECCRNCDDMAEVPEGSGYYCEWLGTPIDDPDNETCFEFICGEKFEEE